MRRSEEVVVERNELLRLPVTGPRTAVSGWLRRESRSRKTVLRGRYWPRCTARLARCWYHACTHPMDPSIDVGVLVRLVGQVAKKRARPCPAKPKRRVRREVRN